MKIITLIKQWFSLSFIVFAIFCNGCIQSEYEYTRLLPLPGFSNAIPEGINNTGVLVGSMSDENDISHTIRKGFIFKGGEYTELLPPGWESAVAYAINDNDVVIGRGVENGEEKSFIYKDGVYTELLPPGYIFADARDINNNDVVLGTGVAGNSNGEQRGFIYKNGEYTDLLPPGWESAFTEDINNNDVVVGFGRRNSEDYNFTYEDGAYEYWSGPTPHAINDCGVIAGDAWWGKGFIFEDGEYTEILPPGWDETEAWGINNSGVVIGGVVPSYQSGMRDYPIKGFIYKGGQYTNFLPPGCIAAYPKAINDNGVVVGVGLKLMGASGFIATPVMP